MIRHKNFPLLLICMISILTASLCQYSVAAAKTMISDSAGYLSREEAAQIEDTCDTILQQFNTSVFIITTEKLGKSDDYKQYLEKQANKVEPGENLVILFISTKKKDSVCYISCHGEIKNFLTKDRIKNMTRAVENRVEKEDYYEAIDIFCDDVTQGVTIKPSLDGFIFQSFPQLIFSLLLGCGVVYYLLRTGKKQQAVLSTYLRREHAMDLGHLDHFSHKEIKVLKDKKKKGRSDNDDSE